MSDIEVIIQLMDKSITIAVLIWMLYAERVRASLAEKYIKEQHERQADYIRDMTRDCFNKAKPAD